MSSVAVLKPSHKLDAFDCGEPAQNEWLKKRAFRNCQSNDTQTYVIVDDDSQVVAFYGLAVGSVVHAALPGGLRRNAPDPVSCVLLVQLGVTLAYQGIGVGKELILHAMGQTLKIATLAGCRLFALHPARPALIRYYEKFGFIALNVSPTLMAMSVSKLPPLLQAVATDRPVSEK